MVAGAGTSAPPKAATTVAEHSDPTPPGSSHVPSSEPCTSAQTDSGAGNGDDGKPPNASSPPATPSLDSSAPLSGGAVSGAAASEAQETTSEGNVDLREDGCTRLFCANCQRAVDIDVFVAHSEECSSKVRGRCGMIMCCVDACGGFVQTIKARGSSHHSRHRLCGFPLRSTSACFVGGGWCEVPAVPMTAVLQRLCPPTQRQSSGSLSFPLQGIGIGEQRVPSAQSLVSPWPGSVTDFLRPASKRQRTARLPDVAGAAGPTLVSSIQGVSEDAEAFLVSHAQAAWCQHPCDACPVHGQWRRLFRAQHSSRQLQRFVHRTCSTAQASGRLLLAFAAGKQEGARQVQPTGAGNAQRSDASVRVVH